MRMRYPSPLIPACLRRYKRFLADMRMEDGSEITVHCANPGSMLSWPSPAGAAGSATHPGPRASSAYSWELEEAPTGCIGINTARANPMVAEALAAGAIPELAGWPIVRREADGRSRLAARLPSLRRRTGRICWLEVKSVTMSRQPGLAEWPDAKSSRGARHLEALSAPGQCGAKATLLFLAQRSGLHRVPGRRRHRPGLCRPGFRPPCDRAKVRILAYDCSRVVRPGSNCASH